MSILDCRVLKNGKCEVSQKYRDAKHNGIDLVGANYTLDHVVAHSAGTVVGLVSNCNRNTSKTGERIYGNYIKIKHDNGMYTFYAHLKYGSVAVSLNQRVEKGQVLGSMGNTGYSFGAHLHFEVRNASNVQIDPTEYLNADIVKQEQPAQNGITYTVQPGDTLTKIANRYNTKWEQIYADNKAIIGTNPDIIQPGQTLKINVANNTTTSNVTIYKVNANSGLWLLDSNGRKVKAYVKGTEVEYLGAGYTKYGYNYVKVKALADGKVGYMAKAYLA